MALELLLGRELRPEAEVVALAHRHVDELPGDVPLDREVTGGDRAEHLRDLAADPVEVGGVQLRPLAGIVEEAVDRAVRSRQADLETHAGRDRAVVAQPPERRVGLDREVAVAQVVEADRAPGPDAEAPDPLEVLDRRRLASRSGCSSSCAGGASVSSMSGAREHEHREHPDPVGARPDLAVREAGDVAVERAAAARNASSAVVERQAAHQQHVAAACVLRPCPQPPPVRVCRRGARAGRAAPGRAHRTPPARWAPAAARTRGGVEFALRTYVRWTTHSTAPAPPPAAGCALLIAQREHSCGIVGAARRPAEGSSGDVQRRQRGGRGRAVTDARGVKARRCRPGPGPRSRENQRPRSQENQRVRGGRADGPFRGTGRGRAADGRDGRWCTMSAHEAAVALTVPEPELTPEEMVERAIALRADLVADQAETEKRTFYSPEMHQRFLDAGFYHLYVPRRYGGYEFDVPTYMRGSCGDRARLRLDRVVPGPDDEPRADGRFVVAAGGAGRDLRRAATSARARSRPPVGTATRDDAAGRSTARSRSPPARRTRRSTWARRCCRRRRREGAAAAAAVRRAAPRVGDARRLGRHARPQGLGLPQHPLRSRPRSRRAGASRAT